MPEPISDPAPPQAGPRRPMTQPAPGGVIYGLGFVGGVVYYVQTASGFWMGSLGILKALVWPAVLVYELLRLVQG